MSELVMPSNYVDMDQAELEYDGGASLTNVLKIVGICQIIVGVIGMAGSLWMGVVAVAGLGMTITGFALPNDDPKTSDTSRDTW